MALTYNNLTGTITTGSNNVFLTVSGKTTSTGYTQSIWPTGSITTGSIGANSIYGGVYTSYKPSKIETIKELREYCDSIDEVTEFDYNFIEERIPFNTDLLLILNKAGIRSTYIDILNRSKKIKKVLKNG